MKRDDGKYGLDVFDKIKYGNYFQLYQLQESFSIMYCDYAAINVALSSNINFAGMIENPIHKGLKY